MYPQWYTRELDQIEEDYDQGLISNEEYTENIESIDESLEEYYDQGRYYDN